MSKAERGWEVSKHDPIEKLDDNLWSVRTALPKNRNGDRRMAIAKLQDGRLVFYNACPLEEPAMEQIAAWGKPSFLILPYNLHMMDGHAFQQRLGLKVYGPKHDAKMAKRVKVEGGFEDFPADPSVQIIPVEGTKHGEPVMVVRSGDGKRTSLVFCDLFMNIPSEGAGFVPRLVGLAGGPRVPWVMKMMFVKDAPSFKKQLLGWAEEPSLARLIPSHGAIVAQEAGRTLKEVAGRL
jgi:hypothetical protein